MIQSLVQFTTGGARGVAAFVGSSEARVVESATSTLDLAHEALDRDTTLAELVSGRLGCSLDLSGATLLTPIDHPDPARLMVSGTGLTHLGSADGRDKMHQAAAAGAVTDSMRMFLMGLEGGKPQEGSSGVQPEWFYKGDGTILVATDSPLSKPSFAGDGGEEPEIGGVYLIAPDGSPVRLGFVMGNEFSDHSTEGVNYLWLAHSKLRQAAIAPELRLGDLPRNVRGSSRIRRNHAVLWEKPFLSGEENMSHSIGNLEHHHFKYAQFRQPGAVHLHFFGTATLSCGDGIETSEGDVFELECDAFNLPLRNDLRFAPDEGLQTVRTL